MRIFHDPGHRAHESMSELHEGRLVRSFECPERMDRVLEALADRGFAGPETPPPVPPAALAAVHDAGYLAFLASAHADWAALHGDTAAIPFTWPVPGLRRLAPPAEIEGRLGHFNFSVDTAILAGTWAAACGSAASAHAGALAVAAGAAAFALCRPPGHHAHADLYGGYCYLNNAAVAAQALRDAGAARVTVLDVDYHHGNGTQAIFWERGDVQTVSIHADPVAEFPYFLGHADETGAGAGAGACLNLPLPKGTGWQGWSAALDTALAAVRAHGPEALVVSLGVDTYEGDPISGFRLQTGDFPRIGQAVRGLGLPTLWVMEGGYAVDALGTNVTGVLTGYLDG